MNATGQNQVTVQSDETPISEDNLPTLPPLHYPGKLLSGNEAIAQAAWEAGVHVACGYPGTPGTEILETIARFPEIKCEWSTNEKVALEIAIGASFAGARALVSMKHVGLNVAADPFFSAAYTGVNGGLVVISADDPGMHSSQNEQDNRLLASAARIPILEPSSCQEARDYVIAAFELSERFDTPVMIRTTTRISHGKAPVKVGTRKTIPYRPYRKQPDKNILLPSVSRHRHRNIESIQMPGLKQASGLFTRIYEGTSDIAFITGGTSFHYVREAFPNAAVMKIGMAYPLPENEIRAFAEHRKRIVVVEELEPFLEHRIAAFGISVEGKSLFPRCGELSVDIIREALDPVEAAASSRRMDIEPLPPRPPVMCAGCSHRGTFYALKQLGAIVAGDVGCYTLGALAPLEAIDCSINMGASISMAHGMEKVLSAQERKRLVAVIGDSTFFHSGISALIDVLYNGANTTTIILDNHTSAMTGHQAHPGSGENIIGEAAPRINIEALCTGLGIESVKRTNPYDLLNTLRVIQEEMNRKGPSVIIADAACALKAEVCFGKPPQINAEQCTRCFSCSQIGCPAIEMEDDHLKINHLLCVACGHCEQVCSDCNAGLDIPLILELMHQKRYRDALDVILRESPLPAVASRVCPHPCDHRTNALGFNQAQQRALQYPDLTADFPQASHPAAISVCAIERFLGDYGIVNTTGVDYAPVDENGFRVAIIGAGPAGLSSAWHLRRYGYAVTVYDKNEQPGGILRYGVPGFRLSKQILDAEIERLSDTGIHFLCNFPVNNDITYDILKNENEAVIIATGKSSPRHLSLKGDDNIREGLMNGLDFLHAYNSNALTSINGHVAVIGGGNTAIDCARSAVRLGAAVTVYYRRGRDRMSAFPEAVREAESEGVRFEYYAVPNRVLSQHGCLTEIEMIRAERNTLHHTIAAGDNTFLVPVTQVIIAIGETANLQFLSESDIEGAHGVRVSFMGRTHSDGVFSCGDVAFGHGTVTQAIATGKRAAESVHAYLQQLDRDNVELMATNSLEGKMIRLSDEH